MRPSPSSVKTLSSSFSPTAKQPWLRPSLPCVAIMSRFEYQAPWTTIARSSALLLVGSSPISRCEGRACRHNSRRRGRRLRRSLRIHLVREALKHAGMLGIRANAMRDQQRIGCAGAQVDEVEPRPRGRQSRSRQSQFGHAGGRGSMLLKRGDRALEQLGPDAARRRRDARGPCDRSRDRGDGKGWRGNRCGRDGARGTAGKQARTRDRRRGFQKCAARGSRFHQFTHAPLRPNKIPLCQQYSKWMPRFGEQVPEPAPLVPHVARFVVEERPATGPWPQRIQL